MRTQAFQDFRNGRPESQGSFGDVIHPADPINDIFDSIIPKEGTGHDIRPSKARRDPDGQGRSSSLHSSRNHLKQTSISSSGFISSAPSIRDDEESSFGDLPPMPRPGRGNPGNSSDTSAQSPERRSVRSSSKQRIPVPQRRSSRLRAESNRSSSDFGDADVSESTALPENAFEELEGARRLLAAAEKINSDSSHQRQPSMQSDRSATPPPIGRRRRRTDHGSGDGSVARSLAPPSSEPVVLPQDAAHFLPVSRRQSQASLVSYQSRRSSHRHTQQMNGRTATLTQLPTGTESGLYPPGTRSSNRPRSRQESVREFDEIREEANPLEKYNQLHADAGTNRVPRHSSLTVSAVSHRPRSSAKRMFSDDTLSLSTRLPADRHSIASFRSGTRPDFFSYETFQLALHNVTTAHQLLKFSETVMCSENIEFLNKVDEYQKALTTLTNVLSSMHKGFISTDSATQLDVPHDVIRSVHKDIKVLAQKTLPGMGRLFTDMQARIEDLVFTDVYPRFVRHQLALSATRALATDRHKYAGLGDCFCLTDPNKADNPIVFASDGFVKVTGYSRPEIVPRNCRFLQGVQTDRKPVRRLKQGITEGRESVELILNYKKNGDPFWNLLYVAPLFDGNGKLAFFIGAQVNCSTTIHSNADIMKVLSVSALGEEEDQPSSMSNQAAHKQPGLPSARKAFLKAFGVRVDEAKASIGPSGMEHSVLHRMEGLNQDAQIKEFHTAYSKYLVVRADTFIISYYSEGVLEALNPANNTGLITGQEVFRFFRQNMVTKETDYRSKVRNATRSGNPISVELRLQTRRSARFRGDEVFTAHWTPLKDEKSATHWVVIALASTIF
ncbi:hypothetical protein BKA67DRAFT_663480 [Truncatella angustata]|uniref:LOV domain-containing protein n=1 Tax=Truncatella angustata TaxID=152316 RepID=A0A9P8UCU6_9PEZI|nr:uncharacterized protein BKA67DRAFT_663480 [Truncatella angustata]KAH6647136.1 hypothetical protein BKA67DRAFT_663480 [Truncatella angustata]KAH8194621.1 hypothetical protein TruAng_011214 [Truncatella angustata]